jgi:hypothetical protein
VRIRGYQDSIRRTFGVVRQDEFGLNTAVTGGRFGVAADANLFVILVYCYAGMKQYVDIAFDCLPLRLVGRVDVPIDASPAFRARSEALQRAIDAHGTENAYFLYNTRCVFRLANSEVDNMLRFSFEGTLFTDRSDAKADRAQLAVELQGQTCGAISPDVLAWFRKVVEKAVLIEFDHFIAAGRLAQRVSDLGTVDSIADLAGFAGMNV